MDWNDFERDWEREDKFGDSKWISIKHALHAEHFFMCPLYSEGPETKGVQRVEDPINPPESDRPEAQRVDPKSIAGQIRFWL